MKQSVLVLIAALISLGACAKSQKEGGRGVQANLNVTGLPIVKEKESFTILADDAVAEKKLFEVFEKETNVHVNLMLYPNHIAAERKNILLAGGDYPDVIGGWLLGSSDIINLAVPNLTDGTHRIELICFGSRINTFGQLHANIRDPGFWWGPPSWHTEGPAWTYEYRFWTQGVLKSPEIE